MSEASEYLAASDVEGEPVHGFDIAEGFAQAAKTQGQGGARAGLQASLPVLPGPAAARRRMAR